VGCRGALPGIEDAGFCGRCWLSVPRIQGLICRRCGIPLPDGGASCYSCRQSAPGLTIRAAVEYRGVIPPAVYRFKYLGRRSLDRPLGALLRFAWGLYPDLRGIEGIVPVPLFERRERIRGYNQAELLANQLSAGVRRPVASLLVRTRATASQTALTRSGRRENVRSAFAIHPAAAARCDVLRGRSFLLIDDVCTTASTLCECAGILRRAGARSVKALVLARDL